MNTSRTIVHRGPWTPHSFALDHTLCGRSFALEKLNFCPRDSNEDQACCANSHNAMLGVLIVVLYMYLFK